MAKRKYEFRPDRTDSGIWNKLYITPSQRKTALKWFLYGLICVIGLVLQDTFLGRVRLFGGFLDLAPCAIILICVLQGGEKGGLFALVASMVYVFSGSAPDNLCIALLTVYGVVAAVLRENYLRRGFSSAWLCAGMAMMLYEISVWLLGVFFGLTYPGRIAVFAMSGVISAAAMPVLYPLLIWVGKIGGETWKE